MLISSSGRALVALLLAAPLAIGAQTPPRTDTIARDTARLAALPVLGSILPSAPAVASSVPSRSTIVERDALLRGAPRTLVHALQGIGGASSYDDLGSPYKLTLGMRGFTTGPVVGLPQGISVFLDGVPVNEPDAAQVNFDLLPLAQVARVEMLSGTAAILGPNSLGGAINLVTRQGEQSIAELALTTGRFGQAGIAAARSGDVKGWRYHAGASLDRDGGWRQATGAGLANVLVNLSRTGRTRGATVQLLGARSRAETAGSLPLSVYAERPDSNLSANDFEDLTQLHVAATGYTALGAGRGTGRVWLRRHGAERFNVNQPGDPDVRSFGESTVMGSTLDWSVASPMAGGAALFRVGATGALSGVGVRIRADRAKFGEGDSLTTDVRSTIARGALFASGDVRWGIVTTSIAARFDAVRIPFRNRLRPARDTVNLFTRLSPRGGVSVDLPFGASLFTSIGQSFRTPAIIELACADPQEPCPLPFALGDDPPLAPVIATTAEIGARVHRARGSVGASLYRTAVRDDIFLHPYDEEDEPTGSTIDGFFANVSRTRRVGAELSANLSLPRVTLHGGYTYTRATFESPAEIFSIREEAGEENDVERGDRIPLVPSHTAAVGGTLAIGGGFTLSLGGRHVGAQWMRGDEANETTPLAPSSIVDAGLAYRRGVWTLDASVDNALGARFATFGTFNFNQGAENRLERFLTPGMPRTVRVSARIGR